jgi:hypothetical protein
MTSNKEKGVLTDKQRFDLQLVYNCFGYDKPEFIPFDASKPGGPFFYYTFAETLYTEKFLADFINVLDLYEYISNLVQEYQLSLASISKSDKLPYIKLIAIILDSEFVTQLVFEKILRFFLLDNNYINEHIAAFDKFANIIRDDVFISPAFIDNIDEKRKMEIFLNNKVLPTRCLKTNLETYYYVKGVIDFDGKLL